MAPVADTQSIVDTILSSSTADNKFKSTDVENAELVEIDEGNLLAINEKKYDLKEFRQKKEEVLLTSARDATQCLINALWKLPIEQVEGTHVVKLPEPKTWMPREKPVPKKKPMTKWEEYAKGKGILNKKRSRMVFDEASQEYKPRWGYKRANDDTKDWLIEVPSNADPMEDQFAKRSTAKKERVAKNELQRLRNIARSQKGGKSKVPGVGITPTDGGVRTSTDELSKALAVAHKSTASIGKFTERLPKEKPSKFSGKKRKFDPSIGNMKSEKDRQMKLLTSLGKKVPKIDTDKAANLSLRDQKENSRRERKHPKQTPKKTRGKKGSSRAAKFDKKKKGGKRK